MKADVAQGFDETRRHLVQLAGVIACEATENLPPFAGDAEDGAATVTEINDALEEAFALRAINEFDSTIVFESKPCGGVGNRNDSSLRSACYLQEELMLLRMQTCLHSCRFAKEEETAQFEPELRKGDEQGIRHAGRGVRQHVFVSYHDI
jgi:hypothetical protein